MEQNFKIINKSIYFPKQKVIAIGDLHLGYEEMMKSKGIVFPLNQLETTKKEISETMEKLRKQGHGLEKIVFLGDIKHHFGFDIGEKISIRAFIKFLTKYVSNQNIIFIKGNHDKIELENKKYYEHYIKDGVAFVHGDKEIPEILEKEVKTIVMSHMHPAITLRDPEGVKSEKYKCFLVGEYKNKQVIVVPSFLPFTEGSEVKDTFSEEKEFSIVPNEKLQKFDTLILGEDKVYNFGKYGELSQ